MANRFALDELRIICFGASITSGFHSFGLYSHPYAIQLKAQLHQSLPSTRLVIDVDGLPGDRIIGGQYFSRLDSLCSKDPKTAYDWIIVQGGGNDLGWGKQPSQIFEELKKIWSIALGTGAHILALTVTETSDSSMQTRKSYDALNAMILNHHEDRFHVADVCTKVPYTSMDEATRRKIWDDGLHLKPAGYDMMGDAIADRLLEILQKSTTPKI